MSWSIWTGCGIVLVSTGLAVATGWIGAAGPAERREPTASALLVVVALLAWSTAGAMIVARRPVNPVGWLAAAFGVLGLALSAGQAYANLGSPPGQDWVWWSTTWLIGPVACAPVVLLLLFPDGRLPSARWRPWLWAAAGAAATIGAGWAVSSPADQPWLANPTGWTVSANHPLYQGGVGWGCWPPASWRRWSRSSFATAGRAWSSGGSCAGYRWRWVSWSSASV